MTATEDVKVTPSGAIQQAIFDYQRDIRNWKDTPDPENVVPYLKAMVFHLNQAQHDLEELRELKRALAVLKASVL
jgi:hypothetical protein